MAAMKPKRIVRKPEACDRLACRKTKFEQDYVLHDPNDPHVPGTEIPRLKPIPLGPRNVGFLESDLDALVEALVEAGGHSESKAKNVKAERAAAKLEQKRKELIERRARLRAQVIGGPDPELRAQIEEVERALRAFDRPQT
jgi:predicted DNA-binding transcriptional regulator AlpA